MTCAAGVNATVSRSKYEHFRYGTISGLTSAFAIIKVKANIHTLRNSISSKLGLTNIFIVKIHNM
ncbi:MAG: hypothetical protein B6D34_08490 [Candidatus Brocadia sp. UTAMX1]|nr:MAG: hypothetical protein B6D34_08490 [Candidatus Brocadia sp. UTAMX1]